ncbi:MAG TPA: hypothetical protein DCM14_00235 [Clostridiales bacterium UBA8153]|nr:hypothetical protein [Clostridiales bacterium UBA8153]
MGEGCLEARELMPWVINGTANAREQDECWEHIAVCRECRGELVQVAALHARVQRAMEQLGGREQEAGSLPVVTRLLPLLATLGVPAIGTRTVEAALGMAVVSWRPSLRTPSTVDG